MKNYISTTINFGYRLLFKFAFRLMCLYWSISKKPTQGALVVVWVNNQILLVRNSYRHGYTLPGGYIQSGENPLATAQRELHEETGLLVTKKQFNFVYKMSHNYNGRICTNFVYECQLKNQPNLILDQREVIAANYFTLPQAASLDLLDVVHSYLTFKRHQTQ